MLDTINLKEKTLAWFARKQFRPKGRGTVWPSEATVKHTNEWGEEEVLDGGGSVPVSAPADGPWVAAIRSAGK